MEEVIEPLEDVSTRDEVPLIHHADVLILKTHLILKYKSSQDSQAVPQQELLSITSVSITKALVMANPSVLLCSLVPISNSRMNKRGCYAILLKAAGFKIYSIPHHVKYCPKGWAPQVLTLPTQPRNDHLPSS